MAKIQIFISDEMNSYLDKNFGRNKSRILDALVFDLASGKPMSTEAIARAMNKATFSTFSDDGKDGLEKKKIVAPKKEKKVKEVVPVPETPVAETIPEEPVKEEIIAAPEVETSNDSDLSGGMVKNINPALLAKGASMFGF